MPDSLDKFQDMKYNEVDKWKLLKEAYRDVNWQKNAQEHYSSEEGHKAPNIGEPNSVFDLLKDGQVIQRRYYGKTGKPRLDIDMTDHGNPKEHTVVPHYHNWNEIDEGRFSRDSSHDNKLKLGHQIANKDILKE